MARVVMRLAVLSAVAAVVPVGLASPSSAAEPRPGIVCDGWQPDADAVASTGWGTEKIESYRIDVDLDADGTATFRETIAYAFDAPRHGIYRDIVVKQRCTDEYDRAYPFEMGLVDSPSGAPHQYTIEHPSPAGMGPADSVNVLVEGSPLTRVKIGDPDTTITGTHTYVIEYRMRGVVNHFEDHDELYWNVVGNGWGVPIADVEVAVRGPASAVDVMCFAGPTGARSPCTNAGVVGGDAHFSQAALPRHANLTVLTTFPPGTFEGAAPLFEERWSVQRALRPPLWGWALAGAMLAGVVGGGSLLAFRFGRDRQLAGSHVDVAFAPVGAKGMPVPLFADDESPVEFVPPEGIRPAQVGVLVDEVAHPVDVSATIVDLATRGYLRIEEIERKWRRDDFLITRLEKDTSELLGYEKLLLEKLIRTPGESKRLSELHNKFASSFRKVVDAIYDDAVSRGWFHARPDKVRRRWLAIGASITAISVPLAVGAFLYTRLVVLVLPVFVAGLMALIGARFMPRRTPAGTGVLRRVRGFEEFIRDSEAPRAQWAENNNIFSEYLPFAIVLRCADRWAKTFEGLGKEALGTTDWYHGESFSPLYVSSAMSSFSSSAGTTLSSSPSSSGSGGSGGGVSGGGGGGGGGGSW